jgi:DNA-binding response OmpR family regulator
MTAKVLVIDDDPDTALLVKVILKSRQLATHHAINGSEGLILAGALRPDLIILDVMMPGMDGYEVCSRLREVSDVPILMLTVKNQSIDVSRGFAAGADHVIKKPFRNAELLSRIDHLLMRNRQANPQGAQELVAMA